MNERTRSRPTRADRPPRALGRYVRADAVAIVVAIAAVLAAGLFLLRGPARVDHVTITNPTEYDLTVDTASDADGPWLPFAVLSAGETRQLDHVLDQGGTWVFRFRAQGHTADDVTVTRADLAAGDWQLTVPSPVAAQLRQAGAPASPCMTADCPPPAG